MMLCGLCMERCERVRLGGLSAAYGCCIEERLLGDEVDSGAGAAGGVAGGGPLGGVGRSGSTPGDVLNEGVADGCRLE